MLDERASVLEARGRRLDELSRENRREARLARALQEEASFSGAVGAAFTRARDDTWRATEQLTSAVADIHNSMIDAAPAPIQSFAREVDRVMAPVHAKTRELFGITLTQPSSFKGRRSAFSDEIDLAHAQTSSGGNNFETREIPQVAPVAADRRSRRDN